MFDGEDEHVDWVEQLRDGGGGCGSEGGEGGDGAGADAVEGVAGGDGEQGGPFGDGGAPGVGRVVVVHAESFMNVAVNEQMKMTEGGRVHTRDTGT